MPTARESVASCVIDDKIYAVGGFPGGSDNGITTNERYDPVSDNWSTMTPMPTGRRMPVTGTVNGKCYVIGGRRTDGPTPYAVVEEYDPSSNSWRARTDMPTARYGHASSVIDDLIYVVGGTDGSVVFGTLEVFDPATNSWSTRASMPAPRALLGAAALNGKIYVMGGTLDGVQSTYRRLDIYDPASDTWLEGSDMSKARFSLSASAASGRIYAIGGADGPAAINTVEAYDPLSDSWAQVSPMFTRRARFTTSTAAAKIYAIGGTLSFGNPHVGMALVEQYTPLAAPPSFSINAGHSDAWFNPLTNGQGFFITVYPELELLYLAWFTFDTERPPDDLTANLGEPGHRWVTALGPFKGNRAELTVYLTEGGEFDSPEPPANTDSAGIGSMIIEFPDCMEGLVTYSLTNPVISGEIPIQRVALDNVPLCEALSQP